MGMIGKIRILARTFLEMYRVKINDDCSGNICVMLTSSAIGDNLVFVDPMNFLEQSYCDDGKKVWLICDKKMYTFWLANKLKANTEVIPVEVTEIKRGNYSSYEEVTNKLVNISFERVILPMHHTVSVLIAASLNTKNYNAMLYDEWSNNRSIFIDWIYRKKICDIFHRDQEDFIGDSHAKFIKRIINKEYAWNIAKIKDENNSRLIEDSYMVYAPNSNLDERSLSKDQSIEILRFLVEQYENDIIVSATADKYDEIEEILCKLKETIGIEKVINYAGKTTIPEYMNLIKFSEFVVGTDSGSIHVAAGYGVKSVALCGLWSSIFLPYQGVVDVASPIVVRMNDLWKCKDCLSNKGGIASTNSRCDEFVKKNGIRMCLNEVNIDSVKSAILKCLGD